MNYHELYQALDIQTNYTYWRDEDYDNESIINNHK